MPGKPKTPNALPALALVTSISASALMLVNFHLGAAAGHALYLGGVLI
ncbi:MAG: hypothetical protein AAFR64_09765 [Pseudomonadota bacterium]